VSPTHHGELLDVPERMIVAPSVGVVEGPGTSMPVCSPFRGMLIGMLAQPGERLREGQPVAWLRVA
jgi:biotin carboxyl carrier protein